MPIERLRPSFSFDEERIQELKRIVPEVFADGKINWETLKNALGEHLEDETAEIEHFGLFWPGKKEARRIASIPSKGTLVPVYGEGLKTDVTPGDDGINDSHNIFIEGENLEVLKILQKSYAGRIKMIYIDPPYNTGNDFVYDDNFTEPLLEYFRRTGQIDEEGKPLTTNKKADGRFHSKWLSMIYPRLKLAKNLLTEDGVIYASIDDNEVHNLRTLMNEVFGEENFMGMITIKSNPRGRQSDKYFATSHEYILAFCKDFSNTLLSGLQLNKTQVDEYKYSNEDGEYRLLGLRQRGSASRRIDRPNMYYPIYVNPLDSSVSITKTEAHIIEVVPKKSTGEEGRWMWSSKKVQENIANVVGKKVQGKDAWDISIKDYLDPKKGTKPKTIWDEKEMNYQNGAEEIKTLFSKKVFDFPKPSSLIKKLCEISVDEGDIVLDFFAGSSSTAHGLINFNFDKKFNTSFIMVQMPEVIKETDLEKNPYSNIAKLSSDRIRKVMSSFLNRMNDSPFELGFRYFKLAPTNFKLWTDFTGKELDKMNDLFEEFNKNLNADWTKDNVLSEILLIEGFPLDSTLTQLDYITRNTVYLVSSPIISHSLLICLDNKIDIDSLNKLKIDDSSIFICFDNSISDQHKLSLSDKGLIKTI